MDTTTPAGRAFLQIQAAFAEMERNVIRQRVREGLKAARARGRKGGRPRVMTREKLRYAQSLMADRTRSIPEICRELGGMPAGTLYHWVDHEEALFRRLERRIVAERLEKGFVERDGTDVDGFISFSLSVQNRRKSRRGYSLENHLEAVFRANGIAYVRGAETENRHRPDFLFPGREAYRAAPVAGCACLAMLGAKSTCKDRWRQVLTEASKIPRKHLLTLEPGISESQTAQMEASDLQLVVPQSIQASYLEVKARAEKWSPAESGRLFH